MKSCACTAKVYLSIPDIPSVSCIVCLAAFQSCTIGGKADFDTWDDWIWEHIPWTTCGLDPSPLRYHNNMTKITCNLFMNLSWTNSDQGKYIACMYKTCRIWDIWIVNCNLNTSICNVIWVIDI